jgi:hypothetical protein
MHRLFHSLTSRMVAWLLPVAFCSVAALGAQSTGQTAPDGRTTAESMLEEFLLRRWGIANEAPVLVLCGPAASVDLSEMFQRRMTRGKMVKSIARAPDCSSTPATNGHHETKVVVVLLTTHGPVDTLRATECWALGHRDVLVGYGGGGLRTMTYSNFIEEVPRRP